jgi:hypothetical protein
MDSPFADLAQLPAVNPFTSARVVGVDTDPALYFGQKAKRGDKDYAVSRSDLVEFAKCPRRWRLGYEPKASDAMLFGSVVDCLLLTPQRFEQVYAIKPATYTDDKGKEKPWNGNATACKEWAAAHADKVLVGSEVYDAAQRAVERLRGDASIAALLATAKRQVMVAGEYADPATGLTVPVRGMIDLVPECRLWLADLKTVNDASAQRWPRLVYERGYHVQAAMYLDLWNLATGEAREMFAHVLVENWQPFEPAKRCIGADWIAMGRGIYATALQDYCHALATDTWRGYEHDTEQEVEGFGICEPEPWMLLKGA